MSLSSSHGVLVCLADELNVDTTWTNFLVEVRASSLLVLMLALRAEEVGDEEADDDDPEVELVLEDEVGMQCFFTASLTLLALGKF